MDKTNKLKAARTAAIEVDGVDSDYVKHKDIETQFLFEQLDLAADARLRRVQRLSGGRQMIAVPHDLDDVAELLQFHAGTCDC